MKGLSYLFRTTLKNSLIQLVKSPSKLIVTLLTVLVLGSMMFIPAGNTGAAFSGRPMQEVYAMLIALYGVMFAITAFAGFGSGASFYSMADVNLLFSAPISPQRILTYGLVKQMGTSALIGIFLLFQYGWLRQTYGIGILEIVAIFLGYCVIMFCSQLTAMVIYIFTSCDDKKRQICKWCFFGFWALIVVLVGLPLLLKGNGSLSAIVAQADATWVSCLPVFGWAKAAVVGIFEKNAIMMLAGLAALAVYILVFVLSIIKMHSDFYEDVLQATEVSFSAINAKKEGKLDTGTPKNVRLGKTGLHRGWGSGVFFYKHMLENRRSGIPFYDTASIIYTLFTLGFAFALRKQGILTIFMFATYMQIFSAALGRWVRELTLPYVYMIPEKPFRKLVMLCQENFLRILVDAVILFVLVGLIMDSSPIDIVGCIVARMGFGILFMAGNILSERILGGFLNKVIIMFLYIIVMLLLTAPGIVAAVAISIFTQSTFLSLIVTCVWNVLVSAIILFCCRNILNYAELNNK